MRNADLDDLKDEQYKEAVAAEWKEIRAMTESKTTPEELGNVGIQNTDILNLKK